MIQLKFEKIREDVKIPTQATEGSAGFDLYSTQDIYLYPGEKYVFDTGLRFEIPPGHLMYISSKSGLAAKHGIQVLNSPALIDSDYRGEVSVILHKIHDEKEQKVGYWVRKGDKIAQFVVLPYPKIILSEGVIDVNTERGEGGFGSTGR